MGIRPDSYRPGQRVLWGFTRGSLADCFAGGSLLRRPQAKTADSPQLAAPLITQLGLLTISCIDCTCTVYLQILFQEVHVLYRFRCCSVKERCQHRQCRFFGHRPASRVSGVTLAGRPTTGLNEAVSKWSLSLCLSFVLRSRQRSFSSLGYGVEIGA